MDITNLQQALETELDFVTTELSKIAAYNQTTGDWEAKPEIEPETSDDNLAADQAESGIERQATTAALESRYRNLKRALAKFAAGTYGVCEISGELIEPE